MCFSRDRIWGLKGKQRNNYCKSKYKGCKSSCTDNNILPDLHLVVVQYVLLLKVIYSLGLPSNFVSGPQTMCFSLMSNVQMQLLSLPPPMNENVFIAVCLLAGLRNNSGIDFPETWLGQGTTD